MTFKLKETLQTFPKINEFVFVNPKINNTFRNLEDVFTCYLIDVEIKDFRFHDLRHTAATRLVEKGADLIVVLDILGYSDIKTTMRYAHPAPEMKLKAIQV